MHVLRSARVFAPSDFRLIWRDGMLMSIVLFIMPVAGYACRYLIPWITTLVQEWVNLEPYFGLIIAGMFVAGQPVLVGFLVGVLFVEERDQGTLNVLRTSPLSLSTFLAYRLVIGCMVSMVLTISSILLVGLVDVSWLIIVTSALLATLQIPIIVLVYAVFVKNKVQALMLTKPLQTWGGLPAFLFFTPTPVQWIGGMVMPMYFPIRLFWGGAQGDPEWWLILPGVAIPLVVSVWLWRRLQSKT